MTRDVGQLTPIRTLVGLAVIAALAAGFVRVLDGLIDVREMSLDAPAENVERPCDEFPRAIGVDPLVVTSSGLIECPRVFDGRRVVYTGEAVRAVLARGDRAWVHLNDDPYGLSIGPLPEHRTTVGGNSGLPVSIPRGIADQITYVGDHAHLGDLLEVSGVFRRADPADGGGPAIRAETVRIVRAGRVVDHAASGDRVVVASLLLAAVAAFYGLSPDVRRFRGR